MNGSAGEIEAQKPLESYRKDFSSMYILLVSGVMVWVPKGTTWAQRLTFIEVMTARKRVCATFYIAHVAGVFYDNEGITAEKLT